MSFLHFINIIVCQRQTYINLAACYSIITKLRIRFCYLTIDHAQLLVIYFSRLHSECNQILCHVFIKNISGHLTLGEPLLGEWSTLSQGNGPG